jgi:hypothetical protein
LCALTLLISVQSQAGDTPVMIVGEDEVSASAIARIEEEVKKHRPVRERLALPASGYGALEREAREHRHKAIGLALERARRNESEAAFAPCVREAAAVMGEATEVLAETGDLSLLRELHLQMGACMVLDNDAASARPHFLAALTLEEAMPPAGRHRQEVELALGESRAEVTARKRGKVLIATEPAGAELWIDGRKQRGTTPLRVDVRLGDHYITVRRFRFEPHTARAVLQPTGRLLLGLEPASRATLREQLLGKRKRRDRDEMRLAVARWSRAEELLTVSSARSGLRLELSDAALGDPIRTSTFGDVDDDEALAAAVCRVLAERCEPPSTGAPWYIWPIVGAAVVAVGITVGVVMEMERDVTFCPPSGCD